MPPKFSIPEAKSSGWTDREIFGHTQDRLKFDHCAGVLAEIIREADTPLTLGVFGSWGSGKTSLMRLIKDTLDKADDKTQFKTLWFDAWTFDKEDALWRAVILLVLKELRKEIPETDKEAVRKLDDLEASLYRDVDREEMGGVTIDWEKAGKATLSGLTRLSLSLIPGVGTFLAKTAEEAQKQLSGGNLDSLFDAVQRERQKIHREHIASLEQFQIGFAELLKTHFLEKDRRLVVFIDDLDRCLPEKAISVLEAIKLFLDAPGCVYVIGTDQEVIEQGIRVKYKDFFGGESTKDDKKSKLPITGDSYLEKIIQIPFRLPPLQEERIQGFIAQYDASVPDDCAAILAIGIEPNPRKVKRTINVFRLLRKLAEKRIVEKEIDEFNAGLLAKIVVIQSRWRDLYNDLQEYPNLIQDLEAHFRAAEKKMEVADSPRDVRNISEIQPQDVALTGDVVGRDKIVISTGEEKTGTRTLLQEYAVYKALGKMLRLPPYFESLKIDQIQLYLYMTHTVVAEAETKQETFNVDQRRWDDLLSNDPTKVRAAAEAIQADGQAKAYAPSLLNAISGKQQIPTPQRVSTGNALGYLGDPRFQANAWYLPDDPMLGFVEIPAGPFMMGSDPKRDPNAQADEQPQHEVTLPTYYIARYPVTVAQFNAFVDIKKHTPADTSSLRGLPNHPVVNITWNDALAYCDWLTEVLRQWPDTPPPLAGLLRQNNWQVTLPSEAEWEKAARGPLPSPLQGEGAGMRVYPWGDEFDPDKANTSETGIGSTSAVGCFPAGASPYGLFDLSGNVWEWTRSLWGKEEQKPDFKYPYDPKDVRREDLKAPQEIRRVLRGGAFDDHQWGARCASRLGVNPVYRVWYGGFRVVVSPL